MKKLLLFSLLIFTLSACSEDEEVIVENDQLIGFWLLTDVTGGIAGTGYEVNFDHLQVNNDYQYSLMVHDAVIQEGTYELRKNNGQLFIKFIPNTEDPVEFDDHEKSAIFSEQFSQLTLTDPCCDLFVYKFEKEQG